MPTVSGSYSGTVEWQTSASVRDSTHHKLLMAVHSGLHRSADQLVDGAKSTFWITADIVAGNGTQTGYYVTEHANGDLEYATLQGKIAMSGGELVSEGTYQSRGGTGAFAKVTGSGTFKARRPSPSTVEVTYSGTYALG